MKIGIYGLGLIGGSLLKALHGYEKIAVTGNDSTIEAAKPYAVEVTKDPNRLKECSLVFVCVPMNKTLEVLDRLENIVSADTIVADVASLKGFVMEKKRPYKLIGTHPMAGTEHTGFEYSFKELFEGAKWVITPSEETTPEDLNKIETIIKSVWAHPVIMDAKTHDRAAALISHMPMLVSQALMLSVQENNDAKLLAASGFRDMTRLAMSNTEMAADMVCLNRENIEESLGLLSASIMQLLGSDYKGKIEEIAQKRRAMYDESGKNIL